MLKTLLSEILSCYLRSKTERKMDIYLRCVSYFFAFSSITLLIITDFVYFTVTRDTAFILLISASCCLSISIIIYSINYYTKQRNEHKVLQPLLEGYYLLKNILEQTTIKSKQLDYYGPLGISGGILALVALLIYQYSKKMTKPPKKD